MAIRNEIGIWGEMLAADYLRGRHCRILSQNFRVRGGEIDIIAENKDYLLLVEVKTRKDDSHGAAREFVSYSKRKKLLYAAQIWLSEYHGAKQPRFDVVEIYAPQGIETPHPRINYLEDAFRADF